MVIAACLVAGLLVALTLTARPARAGLTCATDAAAEIAGAAVKDLGNGWSAPGQGDLWDVLMADINQDVSVYANDAAGARVAARTWLDNQLASLGCNVTTTAPTTQTTTAAPVTTTAPPPPVTTTVVSTVTQTTTQTVVTPAVVIFVPQQPQTVTATTTATVTTPAPAPKVVTVKAKPAPCKPAAKKKPTKKGAH